MRELEFPVPSLHDLGPQNEECEQVSVMNENMMKQLAIVSKILKVQLLFIFTYIKLIYVFIVFDSCTFCLFQYSSSSIIFAFTLKGVKPIKHSCSFIGVHYIDTYITNYILHKYT